MLITIIEFVFSAALFINSLLFIPQIIKIIKEKSAKGVSLTTFLGFLLIQLAVVLHGVINNDKILIFGYILSMFTCGTVVVLTLIYRNKKEFDKNDGITLEEVMEQLPGHIYWKDKEGVYLGSNDQQAKSIGLKKGSDLIGKTDFDLVWNIEDARIFRENDLEVIHTGYAKIVEESAIFEGKPSIVLSHKIPLKNKYNEIVGIIGVSVDITNTKQETEERLTMLENIIALMPGHVYWKDKNGFYLGCNDRQAESLGFKSKEDMVGKTDYDLPWKAQADFLRKIDHEVMNTGKHILVEEPASLSVGSTPAIFLSNKVPLKNNKNEIIGMVGISIDITDRKKVEHLQTEKEIAEKNTEVMNILAGSIAHELRTPMSIINVNVDLLKRSNLNDEITQDEKNQRLEKFVQKIKQAIKETTQVIDMLLIKLRNVALGKVEEKNFMSQSIVATIESALNSYPLRDDEKGLIKWANQHQDFTYEGDAILTKHVLFNLIKNALLAIREAGKGKITLEVNLNDENFNQVIITDTAIGISPELAAKIFNKFETTDKTHSGAGLGLAFCKLVMESYGGNIVCVSKEGEFTKFVLNFPKLD